MYNNRLVLLAIFALAALSLHSQNCGWADTLLIQRNASASLNLTIEDYFNNDLSSPLQGLCAVEIHFTHQYVDRLELRLTSPSGQSVLLTGPNTASQTEFTFFAKWRIQFLPCAQDPVPDFPSADRWNNAQVNNFVNGGLYTGSYHPFNGCLEDFNTGPVNGNWTLSVTNNPSIYQGAITYLRLFFCDSRGVDCCFAEAGELLNPDILSCVGDEQLAIQPVVDLPDFQQADTSEYGYCYLLGRDGIYLDTTSRPDFRNWSAGNYQVCGLSYRLTDFDSLPLPDGQLRIDSIRSNLTSFEPWGCLRLTPDCIEVSIVNPPDTTFLQPTICEGEQFSIGSSQYGQSGRYWAVLPNYAGCDSTVQLDLTVIPTSLLQINATICQGETFFFVDSAYQQQGVYTYTLQSASTGCDSIVSLNLSVIQPVYFDTTATICDGTTFMIANQSFSQSGAYEIVLRSHIGCDSVVRLNLQVLTPSVSVAQDNDLNCYYPQVTLIATPLPTPFSYQYHWLSISGDPLGDVDSLLSVTQPGIYLLDATLVTPTVSCTTRDTLVVNDGRIFPLADAGPPGLINCTDMLASLDGLGSSAGSMPIAYTWSSTDGRIVSGADQGTAYADTAGTYQLIVTNLASGCQDTATTRVFIDITRPEAQIAATFQLDCSMPVDTLVGMATNTGLGIVYQWSGPCLTPVDNQAERALVSCSGWYYLEVLETRNGCSGTDSVFISSDFTPPMINMGAVLPFTCVRDSAFLDASASQPVGQLAFDWQGSGFISQPDPAVILVTQPGPYFLRIRRLDNGCTDSLLVVTPVDTLTPVAEAGDASTEINCYQPEVLLGGSTTSTGSRYVYSWYNSDGITGPPLDTFRTGVAGLYQLVVLDTINGCSASDIVFVTANIDLPPVDAGSDQFLACASELVMLSADSSLYSGAADLQWSGPCLSGPSNVWTTTANCTGRYYFTVTRLDNGCSRTDSVDISLLNDATIAVLPDTVVLPCATGNTVLPTTGSSQGMVRWFINGEQTGFPFPNPIITEPGDYVLVIENFDGSCIDTARTVVIPDCRMDAVVLPADTLSCNRQSIWLDGSLSSSGPSVRYMWSGPEQGCIISDPEQAAVEVVCGGTYQLRVMHDLIDLQDIAVIQVFTDTLAPNGFTVLSDTITCEQPIAQLGGPPLLPLSQYTYQWFDAANTLLSQTSVLLTAETGIYILEVSNTRNGCRSAERATAWRDDNVPVIIFGNDLFPCDQDTFGVEAYVQPGSADYSFSWTGDRIVSPVNGSVVEVDGPGLLTFSVVDSISGCAASRSVLIREQICGPCLSLPAADTLSCLQPQRILQASYCRPCADCQLQWFFNSSPIAGAHGLSLAITLPGIYELRAIDSAGLESTFRTVVIDLTTPPPANAGPDLTLDCYQPTALLGIAVNPDNTALLYQWSAAAASFIEQADSAQCRVSAADVYYLRVENPISGCTIMDTVVVSLDTLAPIAEAGEDTRLSCLLSFVALNGQGSSTGQVQYLWTSPADNCITGSSTLTPVVSCAGTYVLQVINPVNGCRSSDSTEVLLPLPPPLLPIGDTALTCNHPSLLLSADLPGPGDWQAFWQEIDSSGIPVGAVFTGTDLLVTQPGNFRFRLTDNLSGCDNSFELEVSSLLGGPTPLIDSVEELSCNRDSVLVTVSGPATYRYQWLPPAAVNLPDASAIQFYAYQPGTYRLLTVDSLSGCSKTDSVLVTRNDNQPLLTANADTLINCYFPRIQLQAAGSSPGGMRWNWTSPDGNIVTADDTPNITIDAAGSYIVHLEDISTGCSSIDTVIVAEDFRPPQLVIDTPEGLTLNCRATRLPLDAGNSSSAGTRPLNYRWSSQWPASILPDTTAASVVISQSGLLHLQIIDSGNGCLRDTLLQINLDTLAPTLIPPVADSINCLRTEVLLNAAVFPDALSSTVRWIQPDGSSSLLPSQQTYTTRTPGWYTLVATFDGNGCSSVAPLFIGIDTLSPRIVIEPPLTLDCDRWEVVLQAGGSSEGADIRYFWSSQTAQFVSGQTEATAIVNLPAWYRLQLTNLRNGCSRTDSVQVFSSADAIRGIGLQLSPPPCPEDLFGSIEITRINGGSPPYLFSLDGSSFGYGATFESVLPGTYELIVEDAKGCQWTEEIVLAPPPSIDVDLGDDQTILLGDTLLLIPALSATGPLSFHWSSILPFEEAGLPQQLIRPLETAFYTVEVSTAEGCLVRDTLLVTVVEKSAVYLPTAFSPNGDNINDRWVVYAGNQVALIERIQIFDRWGNQVYVRYNIPPNEPDQGWDGMFEERPVNSAVFSCLVEVLLQNGQRKVFTGEIVLMR